MPTTSYPKAGLVDLNKLSERHALSRIDSIVESRSRPSRVFACGRRTSRAGVHAPAGLRKRLGRGEY